MAEAITQICDPARYGLEEAIEKAKVYARSTPTFELQVVRFLQEKCLSTQVQLQTVFRGLEVLGGMLSTSTLSAATGDENRLITLLRPFLKSSDPQIASKCVLVLGRQSRSLVWLRNVMSETDERIRANLVESLWKRKEPGVEVVLQSALRDPHPRVAANAVYGLYLAGSDLWSEALDSLMASPKANFRRSGIWVLKSASVPDAPARLQPLIRDADPEVRKAAFGALKHLRERGAQTPAAPLS